MKTPELEALPIILDNTVLSNFALVQKIDILRQLYEGRAFISQSVSQEIRAGIKSGWQSPWLRSRTRLEAVNQALKEGWLQFPSRQEDSALGNLEAQLAQEYNQRFGAGEVVKVGTVKLEADGWYISLVLEDKTVPITEEEEISPTTENSIAVDLGLERFLTRDDGSYVEIPQFLRRASSRLARLQRTKDGLPKTCKDKQKLYASIARLHQKVARQRLNFHFQVAYKLFERAEVIFVEDLKLKNLIRKNKPKLDGKGSFLPNGQAQSRGMNKSWLDAGHSSFVAILEWVAWKLGKRVVKVDPWGTSQHCCKCLQRTPKNLSERWHQHECGVSLHRDHNSARLIKLVGLGLASLKTAPRGKEAGSLCSA